ncbi:Mucin-associated surface protein (MASP) [Trypanosoma cruzi]|uniref:Mucin-associated surface protein (MASP) n=1 Tax=Trypanosoma cruzi TaxID=5693 RepID=A0A2V2VLY8_TRYCR|nr:Mucin-associated surface protein (MASP) [Trypanosoma cruzi]
MAMMMAGRVLLVCALCVLWCGAGGGFADEEREGLGSGGEPLLQSKALEKPLQVTQGIRDEAVPVLKEELPPAPAGDEDDEEDDDGDGNGAGTHEEEKPIGRQGGKGGTTVPGPDSTETNLIGTEQQTGQSIVSAGDISHSGSQEANAILTQTKTEKKNETDKNTPAVENALTAVNGENTLLAGIAGVNLPSYPEDGVDSHEQSGEDTTSEDEKNVPSPETAATPQSHRDEGSERTGEDTKATTVAANTTDTTNTQNSDSSTVKMSEAAPQTTITITATQTNHTVTPGDSDGSTAVSHTTSPLLLLLIVACAAAAAVVAA